MDKLILVLIIVFIVIAAVVYYTLFLSGGPLINKVGGAPDRHKDLKKHPRSKFEERVAAAFEKITGKKFPTVYPSWLIWEGRNLELDGYNEELKIAFEAQGPLHTKFYPTVEDYKTYNSRISADKAKLELCKKNGVHLILVDVAVPRHLLEQYIISRLFDIGYFKERPDNYIPEQIIEPYTNWIYESEMNQSEAGLSPPDSSGE